jgi:hypothetical protein
MLMRSRTRLPLLALAAALTLTGCGEDSTNTAADSGGQRPSPTPSATVTAAATPTESPSPTGHDGPSFAVAYAAGEVSGDTGRLRVPVGSNVLITVTSDTADEIHLHGYDVSVPVAPGAPATVEFTANIPGVFELELEQLGRQLAAVQVQ